jgi:DNA repair and recombination RAD54-like protein
VSPLAIEGGGTKHVEGQVKGFMTTPHGRRPLNPVMVISYETFRIHAPLLTSGPIGLVLCDEVSLIFILLSLYKKHIFFPP